MENIKLKNKIDEIFKSKLLVRTLKATGVVIIVLLIFNAGILVGFHKATFARNWGEHYNENFGIGHPEGFLGDVDKIGVLNNFPNAHGAVGQIIKIELPNIIVQDEESTEKVIFIGNDTLIEEGRNNIKSSDLNTADFVVVIGSPNSQGIIEAKLIRVMPNPESLK